MKHPRSFIDHPAFCSEESSDRIPSRLMSACRSLAIGGAVLLTVQTLSAATIDFDTNADYDNNFYEVFNGSLLVRSSSGYLQKTAFNSNATVAVYNTAATGGSGGSGGTAGGLPLDKFSSFTIQADYSTPFITAVPANSFGFYTKVDDAGTAGYAAVFRITSATTMDFRLFESTGTLATAGVGAQIGSTKVFTGAAGSFLVNTFYTIKLTVTDVGSDVNFEASVWTAGGTPTQIGIAQSFTDTTSAVLGAGQVGVRLASDVRMDNFAITSTIPEPGTCAIFASGAALLFAGLVRRKRSSR